MAQAKTLTHAELDQVLAYIASRSFATRNRVMLLTGYCSIANLPFASSSKRAP